MLKRFLEDDFHIVVQNPDSTVSTRTLEEPTKKKIKTEQQTVVNLQSNNLFSLHHQPPLLNVSPSIVHHILIFIDSVRTQLNFLSSCKHLMELKKQIVPKHFCDIHQIYSSSSLERQSKEELYRLEGFLRNLYIRKGTQFVHELANFAYEESTSMLNCYSLNAYKFYFESGLVEVLGFYCQQSFGERDEFYSSVHVKFLTNNDPIVFHQNVERKEGANHYYLAIENKDLSLSPIVEIEKKRIFDITVFNQILFSIRGNIPMEVFFRIMLGCGGVETKCLKYITDCYQYVQSPPPPPVEQIEIPPKIGKKKSGQKRKPDPVSYFGNKVQYRFKDNFTLFRWCPLYYSIDSLIRQLECDNIDHTERLTKYAIDLIYRKVGNFSLKMGHAFALQFCLPEISAKFISGKCILDKRNSAHHSHKYVLNLRKDNGGKFTIILFKKCSYSDDEEEEEYYADISLCLVDEQANLFVIENHEDDLGAVVKAVSDNISGIQNLNFKSLCVCTMALVYTREFMITYHSKEQTYYPSKTILKKSTWTDSGIQPNREKVLSASIEGGQIGDDELDPLTIFWDDKEGVLTVDYQYGDVETVENPKLDENAKVYISNLISEYRLIDRDSIFQQQYRALRDGMRIYTYGIADVFDFEFEEKCLYYVNGDHFSYCAIVKGFKDVIICGEAEGSLFYWTPFSFYSTDMDKPGLEKLVVDGDVTFDGVLDKAEKFMNQFIES